MNRKYIERSIGNIISEVNDFFPCLLLTGARQVGKSTLLKEVMPKGMTYITLDDFQLADFARKDPIGFLDTYGSPLCIDEVQYVPDLFRAIKLKIDADRKPGMYWLTGSQRFSMMKGVSESLAGRIGIIDMYTLSQQEAYGSSANTGFTPATPSENFSSASVCHLEELYKRILRGGYPELEIQKRLTTERYFQSYLQSYVERDVRQLTQVGDQAAFVRLMRSAAMRTGQQLVYSDLARDAGISPKTATAWVSVLQASGIVELVEPYYVNTTKRLAKTPKLYFTDTGLCSYLAGWRDTKQMQESAFAGAILETWAYGQLIRRYTNHGTRPTITYYRNLDGEEVDFVLEENGGVYPLEVKRSSTPRDEDLRWCRKIPVAPWAELKAPILLYTGTTLRPMPHGAVAFPISGL